MAATCRYPFRLQTSCRPATGRVQVDTASDPMWPPNMWYLKQSPVQAPSWEHTMGLPPGSPYPFLAASRNTLGKR